MRSLKVLKIQHIENSESILGLAAALPLLHSLEEFLLIVGNELLPSRPPAVGKESPYKDLLLNLPPSIRRLALAGVFLDLSLQRLLESGIPLLEELYLHAFSLHNLEEADSFGLALRNRAFAYRLKILHVDLYTGTIEEESEWELIRHMLGLDTEGPADEPVLPELERLILGDIDWMSLGASLLAGKLPKLKRVQPIMTSYFDEDLQVEGPWLPRDNVYE